VVTVEGLTPEDALALRTGTVAWLHGERRFLAEAVVVGLLVSAVHLLFRLSAEFPVGVWNDDGVYVVLGKAIAAGEGYRSIHLVGAPLQVKYPPGFPLLLAVPWGLGGSLDAVRATVAVLQPLAVGIAAGLVWWLGRRWLELSPWPLAVCAVASLVLDGTIQLFNIALAEPYLVVGWAGVLALVASEPREGAQRLGRAVALGLVLAATTLFRTVGVALIPAVLVALALHRRWKEAAASAVVLLIPLVGWQALQAYWVARNPVSFQPDELSYLRWLGEQGPLALAGSAAPLVIRNSREYVRELADNLFSYRAVGIVVVIVAAAAAGVGCFRLRRSHTVLVLTTLSISALVLMWPFGQGRLVLPVLPFLGLLTASTVEAARRRTRGRVRWVLPAALALTAVVVTLRQFELRDVAGRSYQTGVFPRPQDRSATVFLAFRSRFIYQVSHWVRAHTTPEDRIMVDAPASVYLYTGRQTVRASPPESHLGASLFEVPGRYLAGHILADSVTVVVWGPPAPELRRDIVTIRARCPDVLEQELDAGFACFRVRRNEACLRELVHGAADSTRRGD
jgi:hypothetical protein